MFSIWLFCLYIHSGTKCTHWAETLIVWNFFSVPDIFSKPYSNSCNPQRWHRPRMHQCPQMPAQSQNADSKGLWVISHSVMILFRNNMGLERSLSWLQRKKKHIGVAEIWLYISLERPVYVKWMQICLYMKQENCSNCYCCINKQLALALLSSSNHYILMKLKQQHYWNTIY